MKHGIDTKHFGMLASTGYYISGSVSNLICWRSENPAIKSLDGTRRIQTLFVLFGKIIACAF